MEILTRVYLMFLLWMVADSKKALFLLQSSPVNQILAGVGQNRFLSDSNTLQGSKRLQG